MTKLGASEVKTRIIWQEEDEKYWEDYHVPLSVNNYQYNDCEMKWGTTISKVKFYFQC